MDDNFREDLRKRFIELVESKRGVQAKLSKAIGKKDNYFGAIKQGNPVNADHLRAAGIVFGPEKVSELLGLCEINKSIINENVARDSNIKKAIDYSCIAHSELIKEFKQKDIARACSMRMIELEKIDPAELKEVMDFIEYRISKKNQQEPKKTPEPTTWSGTDRRKKAAN